MDNDVSRGRNRLDTSEWYDYNISKRDNSKRMTLLSTQIDWDGEGRQRVPEYFLVLLLFKNSLSLEN
jgi:hypothetical protein